MSSETCQKDTTTITTTITTTNTTATNTTNTVPKLPSVRRPAKLFPFAKDMEVKSGPVIKNPTFTSDYSAAMEERARDDKIFNMALSLEHGKCTSDSLLEKYKKIIGQTEDLSGSNLKTFMLSRLYDGPMDYQGRFMACPLDLHKGPFLSSEDKFEYVFNGEMDKGIEQNYNNDLGRSINGTGISQGMMNFAQGKKWCNGLIVYNKNCIVVRDEDNCYGQPGFLSGVYFYNRLAVDIMKQYIVPQLIHQINNKTITSSSNPEEIRDIICSTFSRTYKEKMILLDITDMTTEVLFEDAPPKETLHVLIDSRDKKIDTLEKIVTSLSSRLNQILKKYVELEEMVLDLSISHNKKDIVCALEVSNTSAASVAL